MQGDLKREKVVMIEGIKTDFIEEVKPKLFNNNKQ